MKLVILPALLLTVFLIRPTCAAAQTGNAWNTGPYCLGQTISLYSNYGTSWSWTGPNGFTSNLQDPFIANASAQHAGTYTVSIGQPDGSYINASTTVAINTTVDLCHGDLSHHFSIDPVPGAVDYQWFVDGNPNHTAILAGQGTTAIDVNLSILSDGLHDITAMVNTNACQPPTTCLSINLPPILQVAASNNGPFCSGQGIQLLSTPTGGVAPYQFTWTGPGGFTSDQQNPVRGNSTIAMSGEYFLTVTDANGCTRATSTTLSVGTAPVASVAVVGGPFCIGASISLTSTISSGTGPFTFNWKGPAGWTSSQQSPSRNPATVAMAGQYVLRVTDQTGCFDLDTVQIGVNPKPNALASNTGPYCYGNQIKLMASGGATYSWTGPGGWTGTNANPTRNNASALMAGQYFVTLADNDGCTATASTTVSISSCQEVCNDGIDNDGDGLVDCYDADCHNEVSVVGNEKMICAGQTTTIKANGGASYAWSTGATTQSITASVSGIYEVTATNGQGCTATGNFSLVVHPLPLTTVASVDPLCAMDTLRLHATGGATYSWSGPSGWTAHGADPEFPGIMAPYSGSYVVTATNEYGCTASASTSVLVNPQPTDADAKGTVITCGNPFPHIVGESSTPGLSWSWTGPNAFTSVLQTSTVSLPGTYVGRAMIPATGCFVLDTAMVTVDTAHFALTTTGGTLTCKDTLARLNAIAGAQNAAFSWSGPAGFSSTFQNPLVRRSGAYAVTATNPANGCTESASAQVFELFDAPNIEATGGQFDCQSPQTQLFANSTIPNARYHWTGPGGYGRWVQNPIVHQAGTYTVRAVDPANGCFSPVATVTVLLTQ